MQELFALKPVELSDTVYSETTANINEAHRTNDIHWAAELYIEAFILLRDQGMVTDENKISIGKYKQLLLACHLDAQVADDEGEK
ncbi:MAG: hypothetical protein GOVbin4933_42 [Prokaryotic dsDNA virus sp.]|nr:MAG: hypothetical protein GOVbin4933_42 [Prokaryotic dsDNA virus sp.]|tara:strand:+ start:5959 stop:6213 length:255 start_codon:yes stop_codon:yes gene_type:complete